MSHHEAVEIVFAYSNKARSSADAGEQADAIRALCRVAQFSDSPIAQEAALRALSVVSNSLIDEA